MDHVLLIKGRLHTCVYPGCIRHTSYVLRLTTVNSGPNVTIFISMNLNGKFDVIREKYTRLSNLPNVNTSLYEEVF